LKQGFVVGIIVCLLIGTVSGYGVGYFTLGLEKAKLQSDLTEAQRVIDNFEEQVATLEDQISSLKSDKIALESNISILEEKLNLTSQQLIQLQADYENLFESINQSTLKNPIWQDLKGFLEQDDTDKMVYKSNEFDCTGFAITLRDRAWRRGLRCAFVEVGFGEGGAAHNLNAFQTLDRGLIFVEPQGDDVAYVQVGKPYGQINLNAVKTQYIACSGDPSEFWGPLTYTTHLNPFSYDYYIDYQRRVKFYYETLEAYNKAVDEYNKGSEKYSYSQLKSWYENLKALEQDLSPIHLPMGTIQNIEMYWD